MQLTGVRSSFCASHRDTDGQLHGHSYIVWAWFRDGPDATSLQKKLSDFLATFDHSVLPDVNRTGESLSRLIGVGLKADKILIERPVEGIAAEWSV